MNRNVRRRLKKLMERTPVTGVQILSLSHDDWCPTLRTQSLDDCTCNPEASLSGPLDKEEFTKQTMANLEAAKKEMEKRKV